MIAEKHLPDARRLRPLYALCGIALLFLVGTLGYRQLFQTEEFAERERKQAHRRILRPGPRGDVFDRHGNLLIGNRAHFSAVINLETLRQEIHGKKIELVRKARKLKAKLLEAAPLSAGRALSIAFSGGLPAGRPVILSGKPASSSRVKLYLQNERIYVEQTRDESWKAEIRTLNPNRLPDVRIEGTAGPIRVDFAGLCQTSFAPDLPPDAPVRLNGIKLDWEARHAVVSKYLSQINRICGRKKGLSMGELKSHYHRRLVLPMELATNLEPGEYAALVEGLPADSPVRIVAEAVRHYPKGSAASHALGYVGGGYVADENAIPGADLATFALKGRSGKAGIEKQFDERLRGKDGGDIWRVDPMGSRFERVQTQPPRKGASIRLSIDSDLQVASEQAIADMVRRVAEHRNLPDEDWLRAIDRRARRALAGSGEKKEWAELLLRSFRDAPHPLGAREASTVAGFEGTIRDAERLLHLLYARGVLDRNQADPARYLLAAPPPTPGAAVLLKVDTGELLAIAAKPDYDLNRLTPRISQATFDDVNRREAWLPRAIHPGYAPASTFKLVTAIAALRAGAIDPAETIGLCDGIYKGMKCHVHPGRHGEMDLANAISQSCNVFFFRAGQAIEHETLIAEAKRFGMHEQPELEVPSVPDAPIVPDPAWKRRRIREDWKLEDTFNVAIGQGGLRISPLRMACFTASLARGETRTRPTLLHQPSGSAPNHGGVPIGLPPELLAPVIEGMRKSASVGTARRVKVEGVSIAGKTGTGEWRNHNMTLNLAWFIGFAPVENPQVAVAVLIEGVVPQDNIQGGLTATPVAQKILQAYFDQQNRLATND